MIVVGDLPASSILPRGILHEQGSIRTLISCDSRSAGLARVCLAPAKTGFEAAWQSRHQRKNYRRQSQPSSTGRIYR